MTWGWRTANQTSSIT